MSWTGHPSRWSAVLTLGSTFREVLYVSSALGAWVEAGPVNGLESGDTREDVKALASVVL